MISSTKIAPTITVLMSCYNAERWLDQSVPSVLSQTYTDFEFIIVDDGSIDNTLGLLRNFAKADPRIIVITKNNTGLSDSLNVGIRKARGKWIARLDADDICEPSRLEKQINLASTDSSLVFIGTGLTIIDAEGVMQTTYIYPSNHTELLRNLNTAQKFPPHASALYRTEVVRNLGGYRGRIKCAEDCDLWLRLAEVGNLACVSEPLVQIRKHTDQISNSEGGRRQIIDSRIAIVSYWIRHFHETDPVEDKENFDNFFFWIEARINENGLFEFQKYKSLINQHIKLKPTSLLALICLIIPNPNFTLRIIREKLFGESLGRKLALEWIRKSRLAKS